MAGDCSIMAVNGSTPFRKTTNCDKNNKLKCPNSRKMAK